MKYINTIQLNSIEPFWADLSLTLSKEQFYPASFLALQNAEKDIEPSTSKPH